MAGENTNTKQTEVSEDTLNREIVAALKRLKGNEKKLKTEEIFNEDDNKEVRAYLCEQLVGAIEEISDDIRKESESQDGISLKDIENRFNSIKPNIDEINSEIEEIIEKNVIIVPKIVEQTMDIVEKTAQIEMDIDNLRNRQKLYTLVFDQNDQRMKQYQSEFNNLGGVWANTKKMEGEIKKFGFRDIALIDREMQGINNQVSNIEGKINELNVFFDTIIQTNNDIKIFLNNYFLDGSKVQIANVYNEIIENGPRAEEEMPGPPTTPIGYADDQDYGDIDVPGQEYNDEINSSRMIKQAKSVGHPLKEVVYDNDYNVEKTSGEPATTADPKPVDDKEITTDKRLFNNYRAFVDYYKENGKRIEHDNIFTGRSETEKKEHNIYSQFYKKVDKPNDNPELLEVKEEDFDSELEESENIGLPPANKLKYADDPSTEGDELDMDQFKSPIRPELDPEIEINDFGTKVEDEERVDEGLLQDSNISQQGKTMTEQTTTPETLKDKQSEAVSGLYQGENNNDKDEIDYIYDTAIDKEKDKKLYTTRKDLGKAEDKPVPPKRVSNKEATSSNTSTGKMEEVAEDKKELSPEELSPEKITELLEYNNKLFKEFNLQGNKTEKGSDGNPESHEVKVDNSDAELEKSENIGLPPANKLKYADDPSTEGDELDMDQFESPIPPELDPEIESKINPEFLEIEINDPDIAHAKSIRTKVEDLLQDSNISQQGKTMTEQTTTPETLKDKQSEAVSGLYQGKNNNDKDEIDYIYDTAIDKEKDKKLYTTRKDLGKAEDKPVPPKRVSSKEATSTGKMEEVAEDKKELSLEKITEFLEYNNKLPEEFNLQGNKTEKGSDGNPESHEVKVDDRNCSPNKTLTEQTITPEIQVTESPLDEVSLPKKMGFLKRMANRLKKIKVKDFKGFLKKKNKESEAHDVLREENQSALPEVNLSLNQEQKDNAHYVLNAISDDVMQSKASNVPFIAEGQLLDEIVKELKENKGEVYETFFEQKNNSTDAHKEIITNINRGKSADISQSLSM